MAAGMGSRYGGVKQIDAVGMHGEYLLDYGIYDALHSGYGKVVFIIRKDIEKDFRERLFDRIARNMDAEYVFQTKESLLTEDEVKLSAGRTKPRGQSTQSSRQRTPFILPSLSSTPTTTTAGVHTP